MERSDRWLSLVLRAALLTLFFFTVKALLIPVVLGGIFALLLHRVERRLDPKLGRFRKYGPAILTTGTVVVFVIPLALIAVQLVHSLNELLSRDWNATFDSAQRFLDDRLSGLGALGISAARVRSYLAESAGRAGSGVAGYVGGLAAAVPNIMVDVFLFIVSLYFFLRDGSALSRWMLRLMPFKPEETGELFDSIRDTVNGAVLGMFATGLVQGTLTTVALYIFKVPGALLFGAIATIMSLLPLVGTTPVTFGAALYLFLMGRTGAGIGMVVAGLVIGVSDNLVRPWAQSSSGKMHPLLALLSIFGGIELFGFSGIFIGPVVAVMALWTLDTYASLRNKQGQRSTPDGSMPPPPSLTPNPPKPRSAPSAPGEGQSA